MTRIAPIKPETVALWLKRLNAEVFAAMTRESSEQEDWGDLQQLIDASTKMLDEYKIGDPLKIG